AGRPRIRILIAVGILLAQHALLFEALLIHLVSNSKVALIVFVFIVRRMRIPPIPQPRIVIIAAPPWIKASSATPPEAIVAEAKVANAAIAESVVREGAAMKSA